MRQIVLYSMKRMRIERDRLFLHVHDVALVDYVEQQLQLLPDLMREFDFTDVKLNLPRYIGPHDPHSLILLSINNETFPNCLLDLESQSSYISIVFYSSIVFPCLVPILCNLISS
jgi:hypothetical protein